MMIQVMSRIDYGICWIAALTRLIHNYEDTEVGFTQGALEAAGRNPTWTLTTLAGTLPVRLVCHMLSRRWWRLQPNTSV